MKKLILVSLFYFLFFWFPFHWFLLVCFLLSASLIPNLILLRSENVLCMMSVTLSMLRLVCLEACSTSPWKERIVLLDGVLHKMSVRLGWLIALFKASLSLLGLVGCLFWLPPSISYWIIERGGLRSLTVIVRLSLSPFSLSVTALLIGSFKTIF